MTARAPLWSPVWSSRRRGHRALGVGQIVLIGMITLIAPAVIGGLLSWGLASGFRLTGTNAPEGILVFWQLIVLSPLIGLFLVPVALALGYGALAFGAAGSVVALTTSCLLCLVFHASSGGLTPGDHWESTLMLMAIVLTYSTTLWLATRLICPEALLDETP